MHPRHQNILEILADRENISVNELGKLLNVSSVTIRTDLKSLAGQGKVIRSHGGARLLEERVRQESTFQIRRNLNLKKKDAIGKTAAKCVHSNESIYFDSSTTVLSLAHALRNRTELKNVTVIPTGIWTAIELMGCQNINVLLPASYLRHTSGSLIGSTTSSFLSDINIPKAFLGAWGVSYKGGVTDTHLLEIELKKYIVNRVNEVIILIDGSKFTQTGLSTYANVNQISRIITDRTAPIDEVKKIRQAGVEVLIADSEGE